MSAIMNGLGTILGYVMYFCFHILGNYALAILLFTLLTKVILLPVAIWVQNNGIKIVHLTPELNRIKANHFGDKDRIAEETQKLYKREKYNAFANLIPTFVQLVLLIGLIQVIYHALLRLEGVHFVLAQAEGEGGQTCQNGHQQGGAAGGDGHVAQVQAEQVQV